MFGLDVDTRRNIKRVIAGFPRIEKVLIYGSRAKGNYKSGSDIDLTLIGKDLTLGNSISPLMSKLDDLNLPYAFDISIFNKLGDFDLIEHVLRVGKTFYQRADSGKWPMEELGEVCEVVPGQSPEGKYYNSNGEGVPFYQGKAEFGEEYIGEPRKWTSKATKLAEKDDILMSVGAPVGPVNFATQRICIGRGLAAIRGDSNKINQRYLFFVLKNKRSEISGNIGATFPSISKKGIEKFLIPLPHLDIQKEIVVILDNAFQVIDKAIQNTEKSLKNCREIFDSYLRSLISDKWPMEELGEICKISPKKSEVREVDETTVVSFVPMEDLNENQMYFDAKKSKPLKDVYKGYSYFGENDVLLAKVTPCFENGKAGIAKGLRNKIGFGSSEFFVLRGSEKILPEWIYLNIMTPNFVSNGINNFTGTSGLRRVPKEFVQSYKIPLPHPDIQKEIVRSFDVFNEKYSTVTFLVGQKLANLKNLKESILQQALNGELTGKNK